MNNIHWFNLGDKYRRFGKYSFRLWNIFNRRAKDGHWWGAGILQINSRHLFYIGHSGVSIFFIGKTP